jgi:hypothetical protein
MAPIRLPGLPRRQPGVPLPPPCLTRRRGALSARRSAKTCATPPPREPTAWFRVDVSDLRSLGAIAGAIRARVAVRKIASMRWVLSGLLLAWTAAATVLVLGMDGGPDGIGYLLMAGLCAFFVINELAAMERVRRIAKRFVRPFYY